MRYTHEQEEMERLRTAYRLAEKMPVPETLIEQIRSSFANTVMPDADDFYDCPCDEHVWVKRYFTGKHWTEITDPRRFRLGDVSLALMPPRPFRYYLPAFLLGDLLGLHGDRARAKYDHDFHFTPPSPDEADKPFADSDETHMEFFLKHVRGFTPEQKGVIRGYIEFTFQRRPALEAIEQVKQQRTLAFWDTFEG